MSENARLQAIRDYMTQDPFINHLGAKVEKIEPGYSLVSLTISQEMTNFQGITHGGVVFSLSDMAFGMASNSYGQAAVALNCNIVFLKATRPGDELVAEAKEAAPGGHTVLYDVTVSDRNNNDLVAKGQYLVYRKKEWFVPME